MLKRTTIILIVMFAIPAFAEDPNQWQYGYYGAEFENDPNTAAIWHLDGSLEDATGNTINGHDLNLNRLDAPAAYADGKFGNDVVIPGDGQVGLEAPTGDAFPPTANWLGTMTADAMTIEAWIRPHGV